MARRIGKLFVLFSALCAFILLPTACRTIQPVVQHEDLTTIEWSGYTWRVKNGFEKQGPGPNYFSSHPRTIWVDDQGLLHMTIRKIGEKWYCSEVFCTQELGYGKYSFELVSAVDKLDSNAVLGLFTWRESGGRHNNEIDIEISRWGKTQSNNAQYVVQPYTVPGNLSRFNIYQTGDFSTHEFLWMHEAIYFHSFHGHYSENEDSPDMNSWFYTKSTIPNPKRTHVRINLWLNNPLGTRSGKDIEVILSAFNFTSLVDMQ